MALAATNRVTRRRIVHWGGREGWRWLSMKSILFVRAAATLRRGAVTMSGRVGECNRFQRFLMQP
jgi:hypothetical protein